MSTAAEFLSLFDEEGRYKNGDGDVGVTYLTRSGARYPGTLRFRGGSLVNAQMDDFSPWGHSDESPLDGLKLLLYFQGERPLAVFIEQGRLEHHFEVREQVSKDEFLTNFRIARNLFEHERNQTDGPNIEVASVPEASIRGSLWLTPRSVKGFDAAAFPEMKADRREELERAVQEFSTVARRVSVDKRPTDQQYRKAGAAFRDILTILSPYLPVTEESKKVERALQSVSFPHWVLNWDYELGDSADGEPAIWVNVFIEGNVSRGDYGMFDAQIVPMIHQALAAEGVDRWPYIRLRASREYRSA